MRNFAIIVFAAVAVLVLAAPSARAELVGPNGIMAPTGTNPETGLDWAVGDKYYLVFTTSTLYNGNQLDDETMATIDGYVNTCADGSSLTGVPETTWYCLGSHTSVDAKDRTPISGGSVSHPFYDLLLNKVADNEADLWDGNIDHNIDCDEDAGPVRHEHGTEYVWTGSLTNGTGDSGKELGSGFASNGDIQHGQCNSSGGYWFHRNAYHQNPQHLYAVSEELEIQPETGIIPEPASAMLVLLGLGGLGAYGRKRHRA